MDLHKKEKILQFWFPMTLAIFIYCIGDVLLKIGNIQIDSTLPSVFQGDFWVSFLTNLPIILAFVFALLSKLIMGFILSRNPLGISEGIFLALTVTLNFILGIIIFNESLTVEDGVAIFLIAFGIFIVYLDFNNENIIEEYP